jgi:L-aspartate oxidase
VKFDYIIIGSGVAGLYFADSIPKDKKCLILCKSDQWACNTYLAQGGIAVSKSSADTASHIADTMAAGAGLCDLEAVERLCKGSVDALRELIDGGMKFDSDELGNVLFTKEAAHSEARIVHADGDATGKELYLYLAGKNAHRVFENTVVVDLLVRDGVCYGVTALTKNETIENFYADNVIIASGGVGSLYLYSTNETSISADVHGLVLEHGGQLQDMEMMQFHPTVYHDPRYARKVLLTEALRGEGAHIVDENGRRFLFDFDPRGELAPRDVVSIAIATYTKNTGAKAYLSFDGFEREYFKKRFPNIFENMKSLGFHLPQDNVPIYPAFHYAIGGIKTTLDGLVEGFTNLYAIGEAASNRVHGANRLASNSLLEGLVFAKIAAKHSLEAGFKTKDAVFEVSDEKLFCDGDIALKQDLRTLMWEDVGIVRTRDKLQEAKTQIEKWLAKGVGRMARLRLLVAKNMVQSALNRTDSLGAHMISKITQKETKIDEKCPNNSI